ncbi:MAG: hypothetical protein ABI821_05310 [Pseudomonadota bacterium]
MSDNWPRLGFKEHPALDWVVVEYESKWLSKLADAVAAHHEPIRTRTAEGEPPARDAWNLPLEVLLRALAANSDALEGLNYRKPTLPGPILSLNRAVHFHVVRKKAENQDAASVADAQKEIADSWGGGTDSVRGDVRRFRLERRTIDGAEALVVPSGASDAEYLAEQLIAHAEAKLKCSRILAIRVVDDEMRDRAALYIAAKKSAETI